MIIHDTVHDTQTHRHTRAKWAGGRRIKKKKNDITKKKDVDDDARLWKSDGAK